MKRKEIEHIQKIGEALFSKALSLATIESRSDFHFVGLDKIREPIAFQAALKATGYSIDSYSLGKVVIPGELMPLLDELFKRATSAAKLSLLFEQQQTQAAPSKLMPPV